jgi:asparagine synthase (glutamine-hydrolysing)
MCAIVGSLVLPGADFTITEPFIAGMRDTMAHRGPDGVGAWVAEDGRVGLGHRRLSIIDLSEVAGQPMSTPDGSLRLVFNGEIYNHAEIRKELESLGVRQWMTNHSDTEVILHAFAQWGIECLHKFRGMFGGEAALLQRAQRQDQLCVGNQSVAERPAAKALCERERAFSLFVISHHARTGYAV